MVRRTVWWSGFRNGSSASDDDDDTNGGGLAMTPPPPPPLPPQPMEDPNSGMGSLHHRASHRTPNVRRPHPAPDRNRGWRRQFSPTGAVVVDPTNRWDYYTSRRRYANPAVPSSLHTIRGDPARAGVVSRVRATFLLASPLLLMTAFLAMYVPPRAIRGDTRGPKTMAGGAGMTMRSHTGGSLIVEPFGEGGRASRWRRRSSGRWSASVDQSSSPLLSLSSPPSSLAGRPVAATGWDGPLSFSSETGDRPKTFLARRQQLVPQPPPIPVASPPVRRRPVPESPSLPSSSSISDFGGDTDQKLSSVSPVPLSDPHHLARGIASASIRARLGGGETIPSVVGWSPLTFPDPRRTPDQCGLLGALEGLADAGNDEGATEAIARIIARDDNRGGGPPPLLEGVPLLCDPDGVLDEPDLERVARSLTRFSDRFGIQMASRLSRWRWEEEGEGEEGGCADEDGEEDSDEDASSGGGTTKAMDEGRNTLFHREGNSSGESGAEVDWSDGVRKFNPRDMPTFPPNRKLKGGDDVDFDPEEGDGLPIVGDGPKPGSAAGAASSVEVGPPPEPDAEAGVSVGATAGNFGPHVRMSQPENGGPSSGERSEATAEVRFPPPPLPPPPIEVAVAVAQKMDLPSVLRADEGYHSYEDEDDLVNEAARYFAQTLRDLWWRYDDDDNDDDASGEGVEDCRRHRHPWLEVSDGVLIFLSVRDRICFISAGRGQSSSSPLSVSKVLPWWRLERVVSDMRPALRRGEYGQALVNAVSEIGRMVEAGPPTVSERVRDFLSRFGVVVSFAVFTFLFAAWGEARDRRRKWRYADVQSGLDEKSRESARKLQRQFRTGACPICLEAFDLGLGEKSASLKSLDDQSKGSLGDVNDLKKGEGKDGSKGEEGGAKSMRRVDSYGIPVRGSDGLPLKMLRCGHIFDETCWRCWINSGQGDPFLCPVCRRNVAGKDDNEGEDGQRSHALPPRHRRRQRQNGARGGRVLAMRRASTAETADETPDPVSTAELGGNAGAPPAMAGGTRHTRYGSVSPIRDGVDWRRRALEAAVAGNGAIRGLALWPLARPQLLLMPSMSLGTDEETVEFDGNEDDEQRPLLSPTTEETSMFEEEEEDLPWDVIIGDGSQEHSEWVDGEDLLRNNLSAASSTSVAPGNVGLPLEPRTRDGDFERGFVFWGEEM